MNLTAEQALILAMEQVLRNDALCVARMRRRVNRLREELASASAELRDAEDAMFKRSEELDGWRAEDLKRRCV